MSDRPWSVVVHCPHGYIIQRRAHIHPMSGTVRLPIDDCPMAVQEGMRGRGPHDCGEAGCHGPRHT